MSATTSFPVRAVMLDISRDRVPTRETLELYVDLLSATGFNQFELYVEHTFAYEGEDAVWGEASPLTVDDMHWLDALCRDHGIALVANRNSLGHMERWLRHPAHAHRAENPEGFEMWGKHRDPSTLAVTDENLAFVQHLLDELVATTTTKAVNIGMDEPWEFGQGASADLVAREGAGPVYTDWVLAVAQPWLDRGYRVEMWGDILGHHPEQAERLPHGLALVLWGYDSPDYIRTYTLRRGGTVGEHPGFGDLIAPFANRGSELWVAPGTGVWNSVAGRLDCAVPNILDAVHEGSAAGAGGFLLTSWGDNGHWEGPLHTLVPIVVAGLASADPQRADDLADRTAVTAATGRVLFGDPDHPGAELLVGLGYLAWVLREPTENSTLLWHQLFGDGRDDITVPAERLETLRAEVTRLRGLADQLPAAGWVDEVRTVLDLVDVAGRRLDGEDAGVPASTMAEVRRNWLATSQPGGLTDSLARIRHAEDLPEDALPAPATAHDGAPSTSYWAGILGR